MLLGWLTAGENDAARCKLCRQELRAHRTDLLRHKGTGKHKAKEDIIKCQPKLSKFVILIKTAIFVIA